MHGVCRLLHCQMLIGLMVDRHAAQCQCTRLVSPWGAASSMRKCRSIHTMICLIGSCFLCCRQFDSHAPVLAIASDVSPTTDDARGRGEPVMHSRARLMCRLAVTCPQSLADACNPSAGDVGWTYGAACRATTTETSGCACRAAGFCRVARCRATPCIVSNPNA